MDCWQLVKWLGSAADRAFQTWREVVEARCREEKMMNNALFNLKDALGNKLHRFFR
jgi:hypothetical protein